MFEKKGFTNCFVWVSSCLKLKSRLIVVALRTNCGNNFPNASPCWNPSIIYRRVQKHTFGKHCSKRLTRLPVCLWNRVHSSSNNLRTSDTSSRYSRMDGQASKDCPAFCTISSWYLDIHGTIYRFFCISNDLLILIRSLTQSEHSRLKVKSWTGLTIESTRPSNGSERIHLTAWVLLHPLARHLRGSGKRELMPRMLSRLIYRIYQVRKSSTCFPQYSDA